MLKFIVGYINVPLSGPERILNPVSRAFGSSFLQCLDLNSGISIASSSPVSCLSQSTKVMRDV